MASGGINLRTVKRDCNEDTEGSSDEFDSLAENKTTKTNGSNTCHTNGSAPTSTKSIYFTYFLWLCGGWCGLHHIYLRRDRHAFLIWSTAAGYLGFGLLRDLWRIPDYVRDANEDPAFMKKLKENMKKNKKPPFNFFRSCGAVIAGNVWGWLFQIAIPKETVFGIDWWFLELFVPAAVALGVYTAGNVGRIEGEFKWPLLGASSYIFLKCLDIDSLSIAAFISATLFEWQSAKWRARAKPNESIIKRACVIVICVLLYSSLWASYLYFNAEVTDSSGESIKFRDGIANFLASPLWLDFKSTFQQLLSSLWNKGWSETWNQFKDDLDPFGEQQALKVLGLESNATQEEITSRWRKLSREWHPDRFMDEDKKIQAQEKFMQYNAAYETLSDIKARRKRKNKSFQDY